jgi:hypothetical protein
MLKSFVPNVIVPGHSPDAFRPVLPGSLYLIFRPQSLVMSDE